MAPAVVYLHIGSPKTGTTYLQGSMWANRAALRADGVLLPGKSRSFVTNAVSDLLKWRPSKGALPPAWQRLVEDVDAWSGRSVVLSHEHLHKATARQFQALADSFPGARIEVVLTTRDLARSVPAQWQSSVRQRHTWTLGEYADAVSAVAPAEALTGAAEHFWRRQDSSGIVARFVDRVGLDQVRIVTVPASGGDPDELWWRFARACDLSRETTRPGAVSHESLGAASAEVMRRLNGSPAVEALTLAQYKKSINHVLSRHALAPRRGQEPGLVLPEQHRDWAERAAERMIEELAATGVEVIGDLADLRPRPSSKPYVDPALLPPEQLLEAALDGMGGMAKEYVDLRRELDSAQPSGAKKAVKKAAAAAQAQVARTLPSEPVGGAPARPAAVERVLRRLKR
jgi:hypothetical protein